jgi:hypothetical protein
MAKEKQEQKNEREEKFLRSLGVNEANAHECIIHRSQWNGEIISVRLGDKFLFGEKKMLIEKFKESLREITEPSLKLNAIKAYLSKHLESFVEAMITTGSSDHMKKIDETYKYNSNGYQFEISVKFEKDLGFKK